MEDKLTDFERAEYYKVRLRTAKYRTWVFCVLWFAGWFALAKAIYKASAIL